nr:MAG TPA: hypothetical protein [Caudoviricetes sp.]
MLVQTNKVSRVTKVLTNCYDKYLTNANKASKHKGKQEFHKCYAVQIIMLFVYRLDTEWIQP